MPDREEIYQHLKKLLEEGKLEELSKELPQLKGADLADLLEFIDPEEQVKFFEMLSIESCSELIAEIDGDDARSLLKKVDSQ